MHPYIRRQQRAGGRRPTTIPLLENALEKTLGVPLFQEQLMQMAVDVAGFSAGRGRPAAPGDGLQAVHRADGAAARPVLRRDGGQRASPASSPTRSSTRCWRSPTSASRRATRSASPSWSTPAPGSSCTTRPRSAPRCSTPSRWASTRRSRWSPTPAGTGCAVRGPDINAGGRAGRCWSRTLAQRRRPGGPARAGRGPQRSAPKLAEQIEAERGADGPYRDLADLAGRVAAARRRRLEALATAGAFGCFGLDRREALWAAGAVAAERAGAAAGHRRRASTRRRCRG